MQASLHTLQHLPQPGLVALKLREVDQLKFCFPAVDMASSA